MKKVLYVFLALMLVFVTVSADAQAYLGGSNGQNIGRIDSDGTIRNANGASIGKASGVDKRLAAVIFFMNFFK